MTTSKSIQITGPSFCAGLDFRLGIVERAAPILRYMKGWSIVRVYIFCAERGWKIRTIHPELRILNKHCDEPTDRTVYVGRGSPWGNPFKIGRDGLREEVIAKFEKEILPSLNVVPLRGADLMCWCWPLPCHAVSLMKKANS